jgi:hypothetical protein
MHAKSRDGLQRAHLVVHSSVTGSMQEFVWVQSLLHATTAAPPSMGADNASTLQVASILPMQYEAVYLDASCLAI